MTPPSAAQTVQQDCALPAGHTGSKTEGPGLPQRLLCTAFRVRQYNDVHARAADLRLRLPLGQKRLQRIERIREAGAFFIHVPKNGGTSICDLLYGGIMMHETWRYYQHVAPDLSRTLPSFAIWRDPVERFVSAWAFARRGGTSRVKIHPSVNALYRSFHTLDDAINHVESCSSVYDMDHVFRPQTLYVCDRNGQLAVDQLFPMHKISSLPDLVPALQGKTIPHLNGNSHDVVPTSCPGKKDSSALQRG
ncbi:sulfotransferase family 2 domain-containing protein [Gluconobacter sp. Dm-62]|uniref:sulfotransferase family 2 domain-containing protein n=1 Tax=Gluconobacter sp. Dm-62 TaxID=2799804 RepID=UPI002012EBDC|nr:sulfotransferase family 2 domain-containing protein [Gluconobacter sp. Dm-62]